MKSFSGSAWWLARKELTIQWPAMFASFLFVFLFSLVSSKTLDLFVEMGFRTPGALFNRFALDIILVGAAPSFSVLFMSSPYLRQRTIWEDPFSKRMALYRSLPIPVNVLAKSRMIQSLLTLFTMSTLFYITMYFTLSDRVLAYFTSSELIILMLVWFGYALFLSGLSIYIEVGTNGKALWGFPLLFMILFTIVFLIVYNETGRGIVEWSFVYARRFGWYAIILPLLSGVCGSYAWYKILTRRLRERNYV